MAQILHLAKPYVSFIGKDRDFLEMSFEFESLYLKYERLWYDFEDDRVDITQAERQFYSLRQEELKIDQRHKNAHCPRCDFLMLRILRETETALALNFEQGVQNE